MFDRPFWKQNIELAWKEAPIVWLAGVRRAGKTTLAQSMGSDQLLYINCDLPAVEDMVRDPILFYKGCDKPIIVFDEVHQLQEPSRILKIGADMFPNLKILATGSSTLAASKKFRDTLAGRKRLIRLAPVLWSELAGFGGVSLHKRLFHGGLPQTMLGEEKKLAFYREWIDSFFARDIQRLFAFRDVNRFNELFEYLLRLSGGLLDVSKTATALGISRPTVNSHLQALEITHAIFLLRPFHGGGQKELVRIPRIYGFDTGFVSFAKGWSPLRSTDIGFLWEHLVLDHLKAHLPDFPIYYWRDKTGREIDFVVVRNRDEVDTIECKWDPTEFDTAGLKAFRSSYPRGINYVVSPLTVPAYAKSLNSMKIKVCDPSGIERNSA